MRLDIIAAAWLAYWPFFGLVAYGVRRYDQWRDRKAE